MKTGQIPKSKKIKARHKPRARPFKFNKVLDILKIKGLLPHVKQLLIDIIHLIKINNLVVKLKVGLEDPADTGILCAVITPLNGFINHRFHHEIDIQPCFDGDLMILGHAFGKFKLSPIEIVAVAVKFLFSIPAIKIVKVVLSNK